MEATSLFPIRDDADHRRALVRMREIWGAAEGTVEAAELDAWVTLVDAYERAHVEIPAVRPLEVLQYAVAEMGHTQGELASLIGSASRASEVLAGKRNLTLPMIRAISREWKIPVGLLVGESDETPRRRRAAASRKAIRRPLRPASGRVTAKA